MHSLFTVYYELSLTDTACVNDLRHFFTHTFGTILLPVKRKIIHTAIALTVVIVPLLVIDAPVSARVVSIALLCLYLWLAEITPPFAPTLVLWAAIPILLSPIDPSYSVGRVLGWAADPVMALFFGGFSLGIATSVYQLDEILARWCMQRGGRRFWSFLLLIMLMTAFLSMWLSNIAAAALVIAVLRPILARFEEDHALRRNLLIGVALGADLGGIATPIGTGPNGIAIASVSSAIHISFAQWMAFALPITLGMLCLGFIFLFLRTRHEAPHWNRLNPPMVAEGDPVSQTDATKRRLFLIVAALTVFLWLTEPFHGVPAAVIALAAAGVLFLSGLLKKRDLAKIDWSTLLLIAGGITLGRLLEQSGIVRELAANIPFAELHVTLSLVIICLASALLSALMSNTATSVLLIPLALAIVPAPSTAILVAVSASFGIPFVISTPQNAMAYGEGGIRFGDLFRPGIVLMIVGCLIVALTGRPVLNFVGIP